MALSTTIRPFRPSDFPVVASWWERAGEIAPTRDMMPLESSYVLELGGLPALAVALYLTNTREACYVENFAGNPELKGEARRSATLELLAHIEKVAKARGYKRLFCMAHKDALVKRYTEIGFQATLSGVTTFAKEIE